MIRGGFIIDKKETLGSLFFREILIPFDIMRLGAL